MEDYETNICFNVGLDLYHIVLKYWMIIDLCLIEKPKRTFFQIKQIIKQEVQNIKSVIKK